MKKPRTDFARGWDAHIAYQTEWKEVYCGGGGFGILFILCGTLPLMFALVALLIPDYPIVFTWEMLYFLPIAALGVWMEWRRGIKHEAKVKEFREKWEEMFQKEF